jgi:acetyl esterase/lipase
MRRILFLSFVIFALYVNFPREVDADPPLELPNGVTAYRDVNYVPGGHNPRQALDLFVPDKANSINKMDPVPLIIWIHGGGWRSGDKSDGDSIMAVLLGYGFAVASIDYRLTNEANYPAQVFDSKAAVRFLRANAAKFHVDPGKFGALGMSAGGHLVSILGTTPGAKILEGNLGNNNVPSNVQAVASWCGVIDFSTINQQAAQLKAVSFIRQVVREFLGDDPEKVGARAKEASPVSYVGKGNPPFLIVHGNKDELVPYAQAQEFFNLLKGKGVPVSFFTVKGGGHGSGDFGPALQVTADFFAATLCGSKAAFLSDKTKFASSLQD